jgi:hypothetical protein
MAAGNKSLLFMEGRHGKLVFTQNRVPKSFPWKNWSIKPVVQKHADGVNGEKRPRLSRTLDYYELTGQMYVKDAEFLDAWFEAQDAEDAGTAPIDQDGAFRLYPRNGTRTSFILSELIWDDWDFQQNDQNAKNMVTVNMRCTDIKKAKTV